MEYIDKKFGIKTTKAMEKHIFKLTAIKVMCIKLSDVVRVIWAVDNKLHHYEIEASVIYIIKEDALEQAVQAVLDSVKPKVKVSDSMQDFIKRMRMDEVWERVENPIPIRQRVYEDKLVPFESHDSLHIIEDRYLIDGETYRFISAIGFNGGEPEIEKLIQ